MVERCPDKTEVEGPIPSTLTMPEEKRQQKNTVHQALWAFARISAWITAPIIASLLLGKHLDEQWGTEPWAFLGMATLSFLVSCYGIYLETKRYLRTINELEKKDYGNTTPNN